MVPVMPSMGVGVMVGVGVAVGGGVAVAVGLGRGVAVLYVHALNPYGFSHIRRATHENADLGVAGRVFEERFRDPFGAQRVARHQHDRGDLSGRGGDVSAHGRSH